MAGRGRGGEAGRGRGGEAGRGGGERRELHDRIQRRLDELTDPGYEDPARKDLGALDWLLFVGFLLACAVGAVLWGL